MKTRIFSQSASAVALCCSLSQGAVAQLSLSLEQAQTLGVEQAYAMQRARIDVEVARRDVKELLATGLPQVNASFDFNHFLDIPTQVAPASQLDPSLPEDLVLPLSFGMTQSATALTTTVMVKLMKRLLCPQQISQLGSAKVRFRSVMVQTASSNQPIPISMVIKRMKLSATV